MKQFGIIITILFVIVAFILIKFPPQKEITLKELSSEVAQHTSPKELAMREPAVIDSSETDGKDKVQVDYYIIIGSYKNLKQAQQKAERLINDFSTNIIILPSLKEGYYRISYGRYSTLEEAKTTIKSVRKNINSDAWIFSVKE